MEAKKKFRFHNFKHNFPFTRHSGAVVKLVKSYEVRS
jgi:hypothetical protein